MESFEYKILSGRPSRMVAASGALFLRRNLKYKRRAAPALIMARSFLAGFNFADSSGFPAQIALEVHLCEHLCGGAHQFSQPVP